MYEFSVTLKIYSKGVCVCVCVCVFWLQNTLIMSANALNLWGHLRITIYTSSSLEQTLFSWQTLVLMLLWKLSWAQEIERMRRCFWIENQGVQIPMEPSFILRNITIHLVLHIQCQSFSWQIMVKVPETVNAHDLPMSCQETGLADWQCSGILTEDFWSSFYIFWEVIFIWFYFSWLLSAVSAQVLSWALMVVCIWIKFTLDPNGHLSVHWSLGCTGLG